jgi:hypothetical protein
MNTLIVMLILWTLSAPISYLVVRRDFQSSFGKWTRMDRLFWLTFSVLYGPIMLIVIAGIGLFCKISNSDWGKQEVKW